MADPVITCLQTLLNGIQLLQRKIDEEQRLSKDLVNGVDKLWKITELIHSILGDAEKKHDRCSTFVKQLEKDLKEVVYDAKDLLDEYVAENERRCHIQTLQWVRTYLAAFNYKRTMFRNEMLERLVAIDKKIEDIKKNKELRIQDEGSIRPKQESNVRGMTSCYKGNFTVYGREEDVGKIVSMLTAPVVDTTPNFAVLPIFGMGGIGKTTVMKEVYNHENMVEHFDLTMWVHVSRDFHIRETSMMIIESAYGATGVSTTMAALNLDVLHGTIREKLAGKRFLLVLDDIWTFRPENWEILQAPMHVGAKGSWVVVTTRNERVARLVGTVAPHCLSHLSDDDCMSILVEHAYLRQLNTPEIHEVSLQLARNCKGLPLIARASGNWLRGANPELLRHVPDWTKVGEEDAILEHLQLTYQNLQSHLKSCFRYCAIFPKGFAFDRDAMVLYWMAEDYIQTDEEGAEMEEEGRKYFNSLVDASLFQRSPTNPKKFVMHDLIHDLAQCISGEECCIFERGCGKLSNSWEKVRHSSFLYNNLESAPSSNPSEGPSSLSSISRFVKLYTLILLGDSVREIDQFPSSLIENLKYLHTLDLSNSSITSVDGVVRNLKHLRFLSLCNTNIESLPPSLNDLYRLQTLLVRNCYKLQILPLRIGNLTSLRHLDLRLDSDFTGKPQGDALVSMPRDVGELMKLQTLSRFIIQKGELSGLGQLKQLRGDLVISGLNLVSSAKEVRQANLKDKVHVTRLKLQWNSAEHFLQSTSSSLEVTDTSVLENLKPNASLKELCIVGCNCVKLPSWMHISHLTTLQKLTLRSCNRCVEIPSLMQLPCLQDLYIGWMEKIHFWKCQQFCWSDQTTTYPSLKKLVFENMQNWKWWIQTKDCRIPSLRELVIKGCERLEEVMHDIPSLETLVIEDCPALTFLGVFRSLRSLTIFNCVHRRNPDPINLEWTSFPMLETLVIKGVWTENELILIRLRDSTSMRHLEINNLKNIKVLPGEWFPAQLTHLAIMHCLRLYTLPEEMCQLYALQELVLEGCLQLERLPDDIGKLGRLESLSLEACPLIPCLPSNGLPASLKFLKIKECHGLDMCFKACEDIEWEKTRNVAVICFNGDYYHYGKHQMKGSCGNG